MSVGVVQRRRVPFWRQMIAPLGILVVVCVGFTVVLSLMAAEESGLQSSYSSAFLCASTADIASCRYEGPARVVRTWTDKENYPAVEVAFDQLGGRRMSADLDKGSPSEWQRWQPEDQVSAELWQGRLMVVGGAKTVYNPDTFSASNYVLAGWISGVVTVALGAVIAWWLVLYRRAKRDEASHLAVAEAEHPVATEFLPLTSDMTAYLQDQAKFATQPVQLFAVILGAAAVIPLIFSGVFFFEHILFNWATALLWATFLGFGLILAALVARDAMQERRDLIGGVFSRATGEFTVNVFSNRAGTNVTVAIGGRKLSAGVAAPLQSIESGVGTADYLPVSGELIGLRDESGQLLWTRFPAVAGATIQSAAR